MELEENNFDLSRKHRNSRYLKNDEISEFDIYDIEKKEFNQIKEIKIVVENVDENENVNDKDKNTKEIKEFYRSITNGSQSSLSDLGHRGNWVFERISDSEDNLKEIHFTNFNSFKILKNGDEVNHLKEKETNFDNYFDNEKDSLNNSVEHSPEGSKKY